MRVIELQSRQSAEVGLVPTGAFNIVLSPNGEQILFATEQGMFLDVLGANDPLLLLANTPFLGNQIHPLWSPDSQWIAINVWEEVDSSDPSLALLNPISCQLIRLPKQEGDWLSSWIP